MLDAGLVLGSDGSQVCSKTLMYVSATVHGLPVNVLIDSGATDNFISEKLVKRCKLPIVRTSRCYHG